MLVEWEFKHVSVNFIYKYTDRLINLNDLVHEPSELLFGQLSLSLSLEAVGAKGWSLWRATIGKGWCAFFAYK